MKVIQILDIGPTDVINIGQWLGNHPIALDIIEKTKRLEALDRLARSIANSQMLHVCSGWMDTDIAAKSGRGTSWAVQVIPFRKLDRLTVYAALLNGRPTDEDVELLKRRIQVCLSESEVEGLRSILLHICTKAGEFGPAPKGGTYNIKSTHSITRTSLRKHNRRP